MTVAVTNAFDTAVGNGSAKVFNYTFRCMSAAEVAVYLAGVKQTTGFTVTVNSNGVGGQVTFTSAPANGVSVLIHSDPLPTQLVSFANAGKFLPTSHDDANDRAAVRDIKQQSDIARAIKAPPGETVADLPSAAARANKVMAFDVLGAPYTPDVSAANLETLAGISGDIATVAANSADVTTVASDIANVSLTAGSIANVNAVGSNIASVSICAANMAAILDAPNQAAAAANSAASAGHAALLYDVGAVDQLVGTAVVGRPAGTPVTGTALLDHTYRFVDVPTQGNAITGLVGFGLNGGGTVDVIVYNSNGTLASQTAVTIPAGLFHLSDAAGTFTPIPYSASAGQILAIHPWSANGKLPYLSATTADGKGWIDLGAGVVSSFTPPGGTIVTTTRLQLGFEIGYSTFTSDMPARQVALEGFAKPFNTGETALTAITGAVPGSIFDCREGLDIAAATVREWKSQSRAISALQETLASRPTYDPSNKLVDFGSGTGSLLAYPTITLKSIDRMPDSGISAFGYPPGGAVWTGITLRDDMHFVVANDGRKVANAANWTSGANGGTAASATLAVMNKGGRPSIRHEWNLVTTTAGVTGFQGSAQGVAWYKPSTKYRYYVADHLAGIVRCIEDNGDGTATHLSANDITPNHGSGSGMANGVAIDQAAGEIYISKEGTGAGYPTVSVHSLADKSFLRSFTLPDPNSDQLTIWRGFLLATAGANGEYADIWVLSKTGKFITKLDNVLGDQTVEGICGEDLGGQLYVLHDGNYHTQGVYDASVICSYDVSGITQGVTYTPTRALVGFLARLKTSTATPLFALGQVTTSSGGDCGWGIYYNSNSLMRLAGVMDGAVISASWPCTTTSEHLITIDVSTDTGTINGVRVNGVAATVTGSLSGFTRGLSGLGGVLGAEMGPGGTVRNPGWVQLMARGLWSLDDIAADSAAIAARISSVESALNSNLGRSLL